MTAVLLFLLSVWKCRIRACRCCLPVWDTAALSRLPLFFFFFFFFFSLSLPFLLSNPASPHPFASSRVLIDTAIRFSCHPRQAEYLNLIKVCMMCPPDSLSPFDSPASKTLTDSLFLLGSDSFHFAGWSMWLCMKQNPARLSSSVLFVCPSVFTVY